MAEVDEVEDLGETAGSPHVSPNGCYHGAGSMATPVASSSRPHISPTYRSPALRTDPSAYRSPIIPGTPSTTASFSPSRFEGSPTVSPGVRGLSVTPRNTLRPRFSTSVTPTSHLAQYTEPSTPGSNDIIDLTDDDDDWGGGAVLQWDGVDMTADSASSVAPGDAGLDSDDLAEEEEWGREAVLTYDWDRVGNEDGGGSSVVMSSEHGESEEGEDEDVDMEGSEEEEEEEEEEVEETEETPRAGKDLVRGIREVSEELEELCLRGMPNYQSWELKKLQRHCEGYGYRRSVQHKALEQIAVACWKALNPLPAPIATSAPAAPKTPKPKPTKGKARPKPRQDSVSSDDVPLSAKKEKKAPAKGKAKAKGKQKAEEDLEPIEKRFAAMIKGDDDLYLRILQYAPVAFDEFVSKAVKAGIEDKGFKIALKKFLDFEGITFYTEEPTGQRRSRH